MSKSANQKMKLIKILEILRTHSDEDNPMTTNQIIARLAEYGIKCGRKALYDDIQTLNECGYEVMSIRSTQNKYYIADRTFDIPELRILLDAVHFANFITEKKTNVLTNKIAALAGKNKAEFMLRNTEYVGASKLTNESIYYSIDTIDKAITDKQKISFTCFNYDLDGNRVYRKNKDKYKVSPVSLVYSENNYYLMCKNDKRKDLTAHRVDRMDDVILLDEVSEDTFKLNDFDPNKYLTQTFSMFAGDLEQIVMQIDNSLIDVVNDKFGISTKKYNVDDKMFNINVEVRISPTFFAWISTFGNKVKIISPQRVINDYIRAMNESLEQYK